MKSAPCRQHLVSMSVAFAPALALLLVVCSGANSGKPVRTPLSSDRPWFSLSVGDGSLATATGSIFPLQPAPALGLTLADFTGDTHPDTATVELERVDSANAHYWIEIRLTEGGGQVLKLTAPFGGLVVTPKDLTGDGNLDLVVHAAKTRALVAVFLNNGRGHFDLANAARFAKSLGDEPSHFNLTRKLVYLGATLGFPESHVVECPQRSLWPFSKKDGLLLLARYGAVSRRFILLPLNRAPPSLA